MQFNNLSYFKNGMDKINVMSGTGTLVFFFSDPAVSSLWSEWMECAESCASIPPSRESFWSSARNM